MEIFTLTISFPYNESEEPWSRTIEVKENFTLEDMHYYIQELVDFDNDHLYEFYIGKNPRNRADSASNHAKLNEIYPLTGHKIYYLFDFGDSWLFQLKKLRMRKMESSEITYPRLIGSSGINPDQYPEYEE